jgi:hypothetical protein
MQGFLFGGLLDAKVVAAAKEQVAKSLTAKWAAANKAVAAKRQVFKAKMAAAKAANKVAGTGKVVTVFASEAKAVAQSVSSDPAIQQEAKVRACGRLWGFD